MSASDIDRFFDQRQHTMSGTIDRNLPIAVTFTAEQWEAIARILSNGPYNVVAPLIAGIQQQCMQIHGSIYEAYITYPIEGVLAS